MGAFDVYAGAARCPACGDFHYLSGQTKLFDPDFGGYFHRSFEPGLVQPLDFSPDEILAVSVWDDEWWRVRPDSESGRLSVLEDLDNLHGCACGRPLATVLNFVLDASAQTATLDSISLLDALDDDVASAVDLASSDGVLVRWDSLEEHGRLLAELADASPEVRAGRLRQGLRERFEGYETWLDPPPSDSRTWTALVGPMHCECCGTARPRHAALWLNQPDAPRSVLGDGWQGGVLRPGTRVTPRTGWGDADVDRGDFLRLRPRLPSDRLTVCGGRERWGCACGAGRATVVLRFAIDGDALVLEDIRLRVVRTMADLRNVDFVHAPGGCREVDPRGAWRPSNRAEAIDALRHSWRLER